MGDDDKCERCQRRSNAEVRSFPFVYREKRWKCVCGHAWVVVWVSDAWVFVLAAVVLFAMSMVR